MHVSYLNLSVSSTQFITNIDILRHPVKSLWGMIKFVQNVSDYFFCYCAKMITSSKRIILLLESLNHCGEDKRNHIFDDERNLLNIGLVRFHYNVTVMDFTLYQDYGAFDSFGDKLQLELPKPPSTLSILECFL